MNKVIICKGENIIERTKRALEVLRPELPRHGSKVLIKPNLIRPKPKESGAVTRPEVVEGIIQYLNDKKYQIFIGESSGCWNTREAFKIGGYLELERKYGVHPVKSAEGGAKQFNRVKLINFDEGEFVKIELNSPIWSFVEVAKLATDCDYIISAAPLKEHAFVVTLTLKNMMGVIRPQKECPTKQYIHKEEDPEIWAERLCLLLSKIKPNLAVIDGTTGMYGSHVEGQLRKHNLTIVGQDPVAVDIVGAEILGHKKVFYLEKAIQKGIGNYPEKIEKIFL